MMGSTPWWANRPDPCVIPRTGIDKIQTHICQDLFLRLKKGEEVQLVDFQPLLDAMKEHAEAEVRVEKAIEEDAPDLKQFDTYKMFEGRVES